jgi:hypothetical protein
VVVDLEPLLVEEEEAEAHLNLTTLCQQVAEVVEDTLMVEQLLMD